MPTIACASRYWCDYDYAVADTVFVVYHDPYRDRASSTNEDLTQTPTLSSRPESQHPSV